MSRVMNTPTPATPTARPATLTHDDICKRAYEKWCKRGRPQGSHMQDWFEAEMELKRESTTQFALPAGRR